MRSWLRTYRVRISVPELTVTPTHGTTDPTSQRGPKTQEAATGRQRQ